MARNAHYFLTAKTFQPTIGACYALRFMCLKTDKVQLCANIPINSIVPNV